MILEGEIKDAKMRSFSADFQTFILKTFIPLHFLYELLILIWEHKDDKYRYRKLKGSETF